VPAAWGCVRFAVRSSDGEMFAPKATGATDADGILRFTDAAPGPTS
jgi:hypothetical protein